MARFIKDGKPSKTIELFVIRSQTGKFVHYVRPDGTVTRDRAEAAAVSFDRAIAWLGGSVVNNLEKV